MNTSSGSSRRSASAALHVVIADQLREQISSGQLAIGASLPSEADLMRSFGVSRGPVRQAVAALRSEGLIAVSRGRPPRVIGTVASQPLVNFLSFSEWAKSAHRTPGQKTVETARRPVSPAAADALELEAGEPVVEVLRVRSLDDKAVMIERTTFVMDVGRHLFDFDPDSGSIFAHLRSCGVDLNSARHTFDAVAAEEADAEYLGVELGSPLLRERRITFDPSGRPLEYSEDSYLPSAVTFTVENTMQNRSAVVRALPSVSTHNSADHD